ncbi:MAG: aromatic aminobenezylarsenical efflux permease ArsG family transporter [Thermoguttaceae bacterium]
MTAYLLGMAAAFGLGLQTAISPCPLATNIAAISYLGRRVSEPRQVLLAGMLYAAGRTVAYVLLAVIIVGTALSNQQASMFLQKYMYKALGPILILLAMFLLEMLQFGFSGSGVSEKMQRRVDALGVWGALLLGILFAVSFCPLSAMLFFGGLITLSLQRESTLVLPALFGLGTALPVVVFAILIAFSTKAVGKAFDRLTQFEWWARRITGAVFLVVGIFFSLKYCFEII